MLPTPQRIPDPDAQLKEEYCKKLGGMVEQIPTKECLFVLTDANARTGKRMEGCDDGRCTDKKELNDNGNRLLTFLIC